MPKKRRVYYAKLRFTEIASYVGTTPAYLRQLAYRKNLDLSTCQGLDKLFDYLRAKRRLDNNDAT